MHYTVIISKLIIIIIATLPQGIQGFAHLTFDSVIFKFTNSITIASGLNLTEVTKDDRNTVSKSSLNIN